MRPSVKYLIAFVVFVPVFVSLAWTFAVPDRLIPELMDEEAAKKGFNISTEGFHKGLLLTFGADKITIKSAGSELFTIEDLDGRITALKLFSLTLGAVFEGYIGEGKVQGSAQLNRGGHRADITFTDIEVGMLAVARRAGNGYISGEVSIVDGSGTARFLITEIELKKSPFPGIPLPPDIFTSVKGAIRLDGDTVLIESVFAEGKGLNARGKGTIKGGFADMSIELMPDEDVLPDYIMSLLMGQYKVSPGYYVVKVKRKLRL